MNEKEKTISLTIQLRFMDTSAYAIVFEVETILQEELQEDLRKDSFKIIISNIQRIDKAIKLIKDKNLAPVELNKIFNSADALKNQIIERVETLENEKYAKQNVLLQEIKELAERIIQKLEPLLKRR